MRNYRGLRRFFTFTIILCALLALFPLYTSFKARAAPIPPGVYLAGVDVSVYKSIDEMRRHLEEVYGQVVEVNFADERLALNPADVDFQIDIDQMANEAGDFLQGSDFIDIAMRYALGFEQRRRDVPVRFVLNNAKLRGWLETVAASHNRLAQPPRVLAPNNRWNDGTHIEREVPVGFVGSFTRDWTWVLGTPGYTLDIDASQPQLIAALTRPQNRLADLVLNETPAPSPTMAELSGVLSSTLATFPGFATVYVHDLTNDEEAAVDVDIAFSGMSTMKIGIAAAVMHKLKNGIDPADPEAVLVGQWLDYALGESNNTAANQLLAFLGDGDVIAGARTFSTLMNSLGFANTYMQSGYDANAQFTEIPTPANQQSTWDTNPDSNLQSTPREMGRILSEIYYCTQGKGKLIEIYPDNFTARECEQILYYMTHDEFQELVWAGLPKFKQQWIVHKHGFAFETHSDVALVWGPSGPYVISVFLYRQGWMDWGTSNNAMQDLSRIVWNYYEFRKALTGEKAGTPPILKPPPGYKQIKEYIPVASTGFAK